MGFKVFNLVLVMYVITNISSLISAQEEPSVTISQGALLGHNALSRDGRQFHEFRGIPYGKIPRRFDIAVPADSWDGIRNATEAGPDCIFANQFGVGGPVGVEDCLFLDVYTPVLPTDNNFSSALPVIFWITGGGFFQGSGTPYDSKYFMDEDVVVVSINFRLAAFGLLNAGIESARGNQALKDQVLALKWVRDNIEQFGGNPLNVTVMGQSTGGGSVSLLSLSPMAQGLFSKAIMLSGVALCPQLILTGNPGLKNAKKFGAALDCPTRDVEAMVECLRNAPAEEVAAMSLIPMDEFANTQGGIHLGPTIETFSNGPNDPDIFLAEDPYAIAQRGEFSRLPMIIGKIAQESITGVEPYFADPDFVERMNKEFGRRLPQYCYYYDTADDPCDVTGKLKDFYFNGENLTEGSAYDFERLFTDALMVHPTRKMAEAYSQHNQVYLYNFTRSKTNGDAPPVHSDDIYYLFNFLPWNGSPAPFPEIKPGDGDYQFSKDFVRTIVSFAQNGKPMLWESAGIEWTPMTPGQPQEWLQLNDEPFMKIADQQFTDSWELWDSFNLKVVV